MPHGHHKHPDDPPFSLGAPSDPSEFKFGVFTDYDSIYMHTRGDLLWHYTSNETFRAIFETKRLWATDLRFLNDSQEFSYAIRLLADHVKALDEARVADDEQLVKELRRVINGWANELPPIYVFCLSERHDDLAQWRGYTPETGGVALGFDNRRLQMHAAKVGFKLVQCVYDAKVQSGMVAALVERARAQIKTLTDGGLDVLKAGQQARMDFVKAFVDLAPRLKSPFFKEELEWRLVGKPSDRWRADRVVKCRTGTTVLVPYFEIPIDAERDVTAYDWRIIAQRLNVSLLRELYWPITSVTCGPTLHPKLAEIAAHVVYRRAGHSHPRAVGTTDIPYRPRV